MLETRKYQPSLMTITRIGRIFPVFYGFCKLVLGIELQKNNPYRAVTRFWCYVEKMVFDFLPFTLDVVFFDVELAFLA